MGCGDLKGLLAIRVKAVEIAGDGEDLWNGGKFAPATTRVGHFPTEPVDSRGKGQSGGVIGGRGEPDEGFCERIGLVPPGQIPDGESLMHVGQSGAVDRGAEEDELLLVKLRQESMRWQDWGSLDRTHEWRGTGVCGMRFEEERGEIWF